ncbi:FixH family protein [Poseidonibacter antarcticus]|uniref:FixH family protein n=1 Tax=Poseidonibacter antarcticus TaxID=2478538 RepID=UPI001D17FCF2|nr:FixH family protein [Poseidonibacter antarcticus]
MNLLKLLTIVTLTFGFLNAEVISHKVQKDSYEIVLKSEKSLVIGDNIFFASLYKDGVVVTNAKVKAKFFMPEMPGMPYMEFKDKAKLVDGKYKFMINLSMGGTWQYHLMFKSADGKVHKIRSSINL